ncbi:hypothetical protein [Corynebacterium sp. 335C]
MGRHSSGEGNARVALGPLILAVLAVAVVGAVILGVVMWLNRDSGDEAAGGCGRGDLTLRVTADPAVAETVADLVFAYGETSPVVEDHCVRPQLDVAGSERSLAGIVASANAVEGAPATGVPAVWVPATDEHVARADDDPAVTVAGPRARLAAQPVGLAVSPATRGEYEGRTWEELGPAGEGIAAPGGDDAVVSSIAAAHLDSAAPVDAVAGAAEVRARWTTPRNSEALLAEVAAAPADAPVRAVAATESMTRAHGVPWIDPGGSTAIAAPVVSFGAGGGVDELTARAGADFVRFLSEQSPAGVDPAGATDGPPEVWASPAGPQAERASGIQGAVAAVPADPAGLSPAPVNPEAPAAPNAPVDPNAPAGPQAPAPADQPAAAPVAGDHAPAGSALVLLDASAASDVPAAREALHPLLAPADEGDRRVALWNFSSPVNPGVTTPVRGNVWLSGATGDASAAALDQIGAVGEPWLWRSLPEAVAHARDAHVPGMANRVVLVSTGADATADDAAAAVDVIIGAADPERPVRVDVVVTGGDATGGELRRLAEASGGSYDEVAAGDAAALDGALRAALGL